MVNNTVMLYLMNIAKMLFPLITLPYLTRVLSVECYGVVAYVKSVMQYMQILIDFGFLLSATKDIVLAKSDKKKIGQIMGESLIAKAILSALAALVLIIMTLTISILRKYILFTFLSFGTVVLSIFLMDYLFRGLEKMHIITIRFIVMKSISTVLTLVFVRNDGQLMLIPIFDIISSFVAAVMCINEAKKLKIVFSVRGMANVFESLKKSAVYFMSNMATTAFNGLNTLLIGIFASVQDVAQWSIIIQLISAVQAMYSPITGGIYPEMIRSRNIKIIKKTLIIFMPVIILGSSVCYFGADIILRIVGGEKYVMASNVFRMAVPLLIISFPAMLLGWPTLGAIGKEKETTGTTILTAVAQVIGLVILILIHNMTLISLAILRSLTEFIMLLARVSLAVRYKDEFKK